MSLIEAIILGILQGLTEFLPVSSSGHIELGKAIFGIHLKEGLLFTVVLHFATAISTIVVFWKDIGDLFRGLLKFKWNDELRFSLLVILSMIPASLVGLFMKDWIDQFFDSNVLFVSIMLLLTGIILFASDRIKRTDKEFNGFSAFIVGAVQAIAILPGISRSGSTIAASVLLKIDRTKAARFSFLMVLPLILGAMATEVLDIMAMEEVQRQSMDLALLPTAFGFVAALISGYLACKWMIQIVKRSQLRYFSYYCWVVGAAGILFSLFN
ncbi:MAG: undecaprenyl-diphosphate phosphatase [Bacteroidia bacterium]